MVLTSTLFGLYHPVFWAAFTSSIVFVCLFRRTGSLWASIIVHAFFNLMLWYPLVGQFVFPSPERALGDISTWGFQLACLLFEGGVALGEPITQRETAGEREYQAQLAKRDQYHLSVVRVRNGDGQKFDDATP